ncbi:MAG: hypothetical protein ACE5J7_03860 [Candidatus Aenigmatarchaeota archaeon]
MERMVEESSKIKNMINLDKLVKDLEIQCKNLQLGILGKVESDIFSSIIKINDYNKLIKFMMPQEKFEKIFKKFTSHLSWVEHFLQKNDFKMMEQNVKDMINYDLFYIKDGIKDLTEEEIVKVGNVQDFRNNEVRWRREKAIKWKTKIKKSSFFLDEAHHLIDEAEREAGDNPKNSLQHLGEAMENLCKFYCEMMSLPFKRGKMGLGLHNKVFSHWKNLHKDEWPKYQTGLRHLIQRCSLKKHHNYKPIDFEVIYLIWLAWEAFAEIIDMTVSSIEKMAK